MAIAGENKGLISADKVEGTPVVNRQGESLGHISDLMIDKISGRVVYAVLKYGSVVGLGGKLFALPWNLLTYDTGHDAYAIDIAEERLRNAPSFEASNPPNMADPRWSKEIHDYYGSTADWHSAR
jgi:sporulation protein YlmC with PRC-barrel domain